MSGKIVTTSSNRRPRRPFPLRPVAVGVVVLVAALAAISFFRHSGKVSVTKPETPQTKSETIAEPVTGTKGEEPAKAGAGDARPDSEEAQEVVKAETAVGSSTAEDKAEPEKADDAAGGQKQNEESRRLKHHTEQLLGMIISTREMGVPPVPISEEDEESLRRDLLVAITNDISIFEDEDERTQEVKERVAEAKRQLADILQKGGSVVAAIREYEAYVNEGAKVRSEVLAKVAPEVEAISNDTEAVEYVESVNEALKKEDIPPIKLEEVGFEVEEPQGP